MRIIINLILIFFLLFISIFFFDVSPPAQLKPQVLVETEYGDSFTIVYTVYNEYIENCVVKDNNSDFFMRSEDYYIGWNLKGKDIIGLYCDSNLRVYQTGSKIIYNDGNGFKIFNEDNSDSETQLIKDIIDRNKEEE